MTNKQLIQEVNDKTNAALVFFKAEILPLSDRQLNWKPAKNKWSVGECVEHLRLASKGYFPGIEKAIAFAREKDLKPTASFNSNLMGKMMLFFVDPQVKVKIPSPGKFKATDSAISKQSVETYMDYLKQLIEAAKRSEEINLEQPKVQSPIVSLLYMQLGDVYLMLSAHCQRHINQIKAVLNHPEFPKN